MKTRPVKQRESIWSKTVELPRRRPLEGNITTEAAVIGAGMAGILTAYLLQREGVKVVVLEAERIAGGQTRNTTAKITSQHGMFYDSLLRKVRGPRARLYAEASQEAIGAYEAIVREEKIECHFERLPSYLYTRDPSRRAALMREAQAAASLGIPAHFTDETGLPFKTQGAVCFENQAQFNPLEFIKPLAEKLEIYERTRVYRVKNHVIYTGRGRVTAKHIIFATHYPIVNVPGFYFMRLHQDRSYCLGLSGAARLGAMYYGIDKGGLSLRWEEDTLILGGGSHRTGKNPDGKEYEALERAAKEYYPGCPVTARWSAQDCMSHDGIPLIGAYSIFRPYWHAATGFKKWGMTSSMVSAMIIKDRICGLENSWEGLFSPQRFLPLASFANLLSDMWESAKGIGKGALYLPLKRKSLQRDQGRIVRRGFRPWACYRDKKGELHVISARCPHMGCLLEWNPAEKTWDCPCHGSRFDCDGNLIDNPARRGNESLNGPG